MVVNALVTFLRARFDEDERVARAAHDDGMSGVPPWTEQRWELNNENSIISIPDGGVVTVGQHQGLYAVGEHITRWDPARVLTEVGIKRRILDLVPEIDNADRLVESEWGSGPEWATMADRLLKLLVVPYADHPDYDPTWTREQEVIFHGRLEHKDQ